MKNKVALIGLFLIMPLVLGACTQATVGSQEASLTQEEAGAASGDTKNTPGQNNFRQPDFGQPEREADVRGVVKSMLGSEVTILKMEIGEGVNQADTKSEGTTEDGQVPALSLNGAQVPGMMGGGGGARMAGGMGGVPGGGAEGNRASMIEMIKEMSTGEESIVIPVGIQMLKSSTNTEAKQREMVAATLEDIKADKMITIWLNESISDRRVAEFVLIN